MLPGTDLVHIRMEYTHFFTGGLVGGNRSVKPVCRYPFEFHVPCKSGDEMDAVLMVCGPVNEVVGAEVGVAPEYYLSVFPLVVELEYQPLEKSCNVDRLVSPSRPKDGKDELSAAAFEKKQGHIAVFPVINVEQRELLCSVCLGIHVIGIDDDGSGTESYEAMKSSMKASPISNSSLRDRRFSRRVIVGWEARSISSEADLPAHIFRISSPQSLSQCRHLRSRPLSSIFSGGAFPSGCV